MRRITRTSHPRKLNIPRGLSKELFLMIGFGAVGIWVGVAFAEEAMLDHRLSSEATALRAQNAGLKTENQAYGRDLVATSGGTAAEEDARASGYARSDERIYIVSREPVSGAPVSAKQKPVAKVGRSVWAIQWQSMWRLIANLWHR
jgi:hypothetical protein